MKHDRSAEDALEHRACLVHVVEGREVPDQRPKPLFQIPEYPIHRVSLRARLEACPCRLNLFQCRLRAGRQGRLYGGLLMRTSIQPRLGCIGKGSRGDVTEPEVKEAVQS